MASAVDPEMKRRFDDAEKLRIHASPLARTALAPTAAALRDYFESDAGRVRSRTRTSSRG